MHHLDNQLDNSGRLHYENEKDMANIVAGSMNPLVGIIIPMYNASITIERALRSVIAQTYRPLEILVIDDGSIDGSVEIVESLGFQDLRLIKLGRQSGVAHARNVGIGFATGTFIAFLDADDEWLPDKTQRQIDILAISSDMSLLACHARYGTCIPNRPHILNQGREPVTGRNAWKTLLAYSFVATSCVMTKKTALLKAGQFNESLPVAEDQDLWIRLGKEGTVGFVNREMTICHEMPNSLSKRYAGDATNVKLALIKNHLAVLADELTTSERRRILARRYSDCGRGEYVAGSRRYGAVLIMRAILSGHAPLENIAYLLFANPMVRRLKKLLHPRKYAGI